MKKSILSIKILFIVCLCFLNINAFSQVSNYTFTQSSGTYTAITGGTVSGSGSILDDGIFSVTLPTAFNYNGNSINNVGFSSNGYLILGNTTSHGINYPISNVAISNGVIAILGVDLVASMTSAEQRWQQIGNEVIFQWKDFRRYLATGENISFQIRLNTATGQINFIYSNATNIVANEDRIPQVGLRGTTNTDYNARRLTTSVPDATPAWNDTAAATSNANDVRFTSTSIAAFPAAGQTFTWSPPIVAACSGTPSPGNTISATNPVVSGGSTALSLQNATSGSGVTYQWQKSTTSAVAGFSNITGANAPTYTATVTAKTWYKCTVTCSGNSMDSTPVEVNLAYCTPSPIPNSGFEYISNVTIGTTINNATLGTAYTTYLTPIETLQIGIATPISVSISNSYVTDKVFLFVDWNQDGDWLDTNESIVLSQTATNTSFTATGSITPPAGSLTGNTRLRVKLIDGTNSTPCVFATYGEVEDYVVNVTNTPTPTSITITAEDYNSAPSNWLTSSTNNIFYYAAITSSGGSALLNSVSANMSGTYLAADIPTNGLKLYYSSDFDLTPAGDVLLASRSSAKTGATENITWNSLTGMPSIAAAATGYIYAAANVAGSATPGRTVAGSFTSNSNVLFSGTVTYAAANTYGTTVNKTIIAPTPATYTWNGSSSTSWDTAANWTKSGGGTGIPTAVDNVIINIQLPQKLNIITAKSVKDFTLSGTGNFDISAVGVLTITGNVNYDGTNNAGNNSALNCSSTVNISSTSPQNILPLRYGSLNASGGSRTLISGRTTAICDLFNPGAGSYTVIGSTVEYYAPSASSAYVMSPFTYQNLTFSGAASFEIGSGNTLNVLGNYVQSGSGQVIVSNSGAGSLNITGNATVSNGILDVSFGNNAGVLKVGQDLILSGSSFMNVLNGFTNTPTTTVTVGRDLSISGTARLRLEPTSSTNGNAIVNVGRDFSGTATGTGSGGIVDFGSGTAGTGTIAGNAINIGRNFNKSGTGGFWTSSSDPATGFVMNGGTVATPATFSYSGNNSNYTSYTIGDNAYVQLLSNLTLGTGGNPRSLFTVNLTGSLDFDNKSIIGNADTRFLTDNGSTLITKNTNGIGGTTATGSLQNFSSTGTGSGSNGRAHLVNRVNYIFNANTTSPFPTTNFGNPGSLTINNSQVVSNLTSDLTVINTVNVNENSGFTLNPTSGNLILKGLMTIENNAFVDNAGENQITDGGGGSILIKNGGRFVTKDAQGFSGTSAAIPDITNITLNSGSTVEYARNGNQAITNQTVVVQGTNGNYSNLKISGSGIKTAPVGDTNVQNTTTVTAGELLVPSTAETVKPNSFTANKGVVVTTGGIFRLANNANLLQDVTAGNSGDILAVRDLTFSNLRQQYNYLISPLIGKNLKDIYKDGLGNPVSVPFVLYYTEANNKFYTSSGAYIQGRALAVKEAAGTGSLTMSALFNGVPMNGNFNYTLANSNSVDTGYNLTGNPYPSNINITTLYNLGSNKTNISQNFYFWDNTANDIYIQGGNNYNGAAYAVFNAVSGMGNGAGFPLNPGTIVNSKKPTEIVKIGQGFMVRSIETTNKVLTFSNDIRVAAAANGYFGNPAKATAGDRSNRFWLNLSAPTNITTQIGIVYFDAGSNAFATDDSEMNGLPSDVLYSVIDDKKALINGRSTFINTDKIPLGSNNFAAGNYTFSLAEHEGIFAADQNIYLKDKQTGIVTNLSEGNYTFTANAGEFTGRFEIIYQPEVVLSTGANTKENLIIYRDANDFVVKADSKKITDLEVYDSSGRMIYKMQPNSTKAIINADRLNNGVYVLKVNQSGEITTKKVIK